MRTFGGFLSDGARLYGEVRGDEVHVLTRPFWLGGDFSGEKRSLGELEIGLAVEPSKIIAVGLNYADHIKEMQRTEIGSPLIWFKAPSSLLPHRGTIEIVQCFGSGDTLAAEIESEFVAIQDAPDFAVRPMARGDRYYLNSFVFYDFEGAHYTRIRAATFRRDFRPVAG